jgi:small-conductance mechanosensitive channel
VLPSWSDIWNLPLLWNTAGRWSLAILAFLVTFTLLPIAKSFIEVKRRRWIEAGIEMPPAVELLARLVHRTHKLFLWVLAVFLACSLLSLPLGFRRAVEIAFIVTFWGQVGLWAMEAVEFALERRGARDGVADARQSGSLQIILFVAGLIVWTLAFLLALDNLGVEIAPLLAGLGIGGIAVALAVQTVLGDLLASMSIALDKPFAIGDFLMIDAFMGTVEHIGVKSTRLRSLSGEQIVMSNADLLRSRVRNFGRMRERRVAMTLGVTYDTKREALRAIPAAMRDIVNAQSQTRFDRCHFLSYGVSALQFELVFFVTNPDYNAYADIQQSINLAILDCFDAMGVEFAFPTTRMITDG